MTTYKIKFEDAAYCRYTSAIIGSTYKILPNVYETYELAAALADRWSHSERNSYGCPCKRWCRS